MPTEGCWEIHGIYLGQSQMGRYQCDYLISLFTSYCFFFAGYRRLAMRSEDTIEVVIIHLSHCSNILSIFLVVSRPLFGQLQCHIVGDIVILHPHSSDLTLQANPTLG